jgi:hypothetical protein
MSLTNTPWPEIIKLFPPRESLVSDIPAGGGKNDYLFFTVYVTIQQPVSELKAKEYLKRMTIILLSQKNP